MIDFETTFGNQAKNNGSTNKDNRPKAQYWINIGYTVQVKGEQGPEDRFVSLPTGIPLDTQEALPTNSRNAEFAAFQAARNNLHDQIMAAAAKLQPGEEKLLNLQIQLRRVNEETAPVAAELNPFVIPVQL